jgi:2-C-methyl-D-erythritol 2,4-cyclodiphosphate synthase
VGNGFDVHKFGPGSSLTLCGVTIESSLGLIGHSDADVGMHSVTDAIYGALAKGDIGQHFPPSDPQWMGADSKIFLKHAVGLTSEMGFKIENIDCTLICEQPKIGPYAHQMRSKMAEIMGLDIDQISVKATTTEKLGFAGRGEGIASMATAALISK